MDPIPITQVHVWNVYDWHAGRWRRCSEVRTWTRNHALACRKAKEGTPAFRRSRFKVVLSRVSISPDDIPEGMLLDPRPKTKGTSSWIVPDVYGEYRALARENARARR